MPCLQEIFRLADLMQWQTSRSLTFSFSLLLFSCRNAFLFRSCRCYTYYMFGGTILSINGTNRVSGMKAGPGEFYTVDLNTFTNPQIALGLLCHTKFWLFLQPERRRAYGEVLTVEKAVAIRSTLLRNLLEDIGDMEDEQHSIPLTNVDASVLRKVITYCDQYKGAPLDSSSAEPDSSPGKFSDLPDWDREFVSIPQEEIFALILAASYLDIKDLLDLGCFKVASMIEGKSVEQIRTMFNIQNVFTPEEEETIRKENEWVTDTTL
ncbi:SCF complex subunit Skp1 [Phlyctochytrium arcticum]|nr:SCF complex subunit Skp1 [Phlyctochytrium arcticum]